MSSFFTLPASQRKRKRTDSTPRLSKKQVTTSKSRAAPSRVPDRESSISGSESDEQPDSHGGDLSDRPTDTESEDSDAEDETGADRRLRLAERYLANIKSSAAEDIGFDAADVDRDIITARLREDAAETKGQMHRYIAEEYNWSSAIGYQFRGEGLATTGIVACLPYAYTVTKDMKLTKWELAPPAKESVFSTSKPKPHSKHKPRPPPPSSRCRPTRVLSTRGSYHEFNPSTPHHTAAILAIAATHDGQFLATGGADHRIIIWAASTLTSLRAFTQHRAEVTGLAFRSTGDGVGSSQLFSSSADRTIKTWNVGRDGTTAYVETLFGHQDVVTDVATLAGPAPSAERCLSTGARDRTVRLWKVADETQLVFRGGGAPRGTRPGRHAPASTSVPAHASAAAEGSIDRVAQIDDATFVTGADNGALSLWSVHKKKPLCIVPAAHGHAPPLALDAVFAERDLAHRTVPVAGAPRWITALCAVPLADLVLSGSWDGCVRVWRVSEDRRKLEAVGVLGREGEVRGVVNDLAVFERGQKGKDGLGVVVATGKEHRLGRWVKQEGRNGAMVFEVTRKAAKSGKDVGRGVVGS